MYRTISRSALLLGAAAAASVSLGAQSPTAPAPKAAARPAKAWTVPHTVDGQPDLTGNWTNATYTPLERPASPRHQGVLHKGRGRRGREGTDRPVQQPGRRRSPLRQRHLAERELRTRPVEPAHVARVRPAGRTSSAADRGSAPPAAAAAGREPRSPHRQHRGPHARRALHHVGQRRPADSCRSATTPTSTSSRDPGTSSCARR